ncbi:hypothetical protein VCRA2116O29_190009 [Vibrio crassostreae]|nr:hypothetical protein VCRA2116O29_190009 [Vibrio crassostreae]CAK2501030.1 hypothetical protein VCRA2119O48_460025 [Vibrio crassostreae]CAK3025957.1 hypothetical protein VCRA2133E348_540008 [Vibrio crassostreae]CAK3548407.1 hypothetical protein VCRA213O314_590026 [Vibrio crassostreae]CAK3660105.1 hypothetical protein VCRA2123O74_190083 [Vibrio crassostreae]
MIRSTNTFNKSGTLIYSPNNLQVSKIPHRNLEKTQPQSRKHKPNLMNHVELLKINNNCYHYHSLSTRLMLLEMDLKSR